MRQNRGTICDLLPKARRVGRSAFGPLRTLADGAANDGKERNLCIGIFSLHALAAKKMLRQRKIRCCRAAGRPAIHVECSRDQGSNSQTARLCCRSGQITQGLLKYIVQAPPPIFKSPKPSSLKAYLCICRLRSRVRRVASSDPS